METLQKTLAHVCELLCIVAVAYAVTHWFNLGEEDMRWAITIVLSALAKFARTSEHIPISDYVNSEKT